MRFFGSGLWQRTIKHGQDRIVGYGLFDRLYEGELVAAAKDRRTKYREAAFNFARPVVNASAGFLAGKGIEWRVAGNDRLTRLAGDIWDRSGGDLAFLEASLTGAIAGDLGVQVAMTPDGPIIRFLDPGICHPEFDPHDYRMLRSFTVAYQAEDAQGGKFKHFEMWKDGRAEDEDGNLLDTYDESLLDGVPFAWIRNQGRLGKQYGSSDLKGLAELTTSYDHLARKQYGSLDYFLEPNLLIKNANDLKVEDFGGRRAFKVGKDADISFIESEGEKPGIDEALARTFDAICRVSETPRHVFGDVIEIGDVSGTALKLMFTPLITKTRRKQSTYGPALEWAMWQALLLAGAPRNFEVRTVNVVWPDPVPTNERELRDVLETEKRLGASTSQVLGKLGYTVEQVAEAKRENDAAAEEMVRRSQLAITRGVQMP
ncbi:phage portal protein [bacterium]|nr:MAG: phage portal protein [bacterium]